MMASCSAIVRAGLGGGAYARTCRSACTGAPLLLACHRVCCSIGQKAKERICQAYAGRGEVARDICVGNVEAKRASTIAVTGLLQVGPEQGCITTANHLATNLDFQLQFLVGLLPPISSPRPDQDRTDQHAPQCQLRMPAAESPQAPGVPLMPRVPWPPVPHRPAMRTDGGVVLVIISDYSSGRLRLPEVQGAPHHVNGAAMPRVLRARSGCASISASRRRLAIASRGLVPSSHEMTTGSSFSTSRRISHSAFLLRKLVLKSPPAAPGGGVCCATSVFVSGGPGMPFRLTECGSRRWRSEGLFT